MNNYFTQPKAPVIGILKDGRSIQKAFDDLYVIPEQFADASVDASNAINLAAKFALDNNMTLSGGGKPYKASSQINLTGIKVSDLNVEGSGNTSVLVNNCNVYNSDFYKVSVRPKGGVVSFANTNFRGCTATAALNTNDLLSDLQLYVYNCEFSDNNYGYLRNPSLSNSGSITRTIFESCRFFNHKGDALEFNLVEIDGFIKAKDIHIDGVYGNNTAAWGIGIGVAGRTAYNDYAVDSTFARNIVFENVYVRNCRQPIHFEKCKGVIVINPDLECDDTINPNSGLSPHCIVGYQAVNIEVVGGKYKVLHGGTAIGFRYGVVSNGGVQSYQGASRNITIRDVNEINGSVVLYGSARDNLESYCRISNIKNMNGSFICRGYFSDLSIDNIQAQSETPHEILFNYTVGEAAGVYRRNNFNKCSLRNITLIDSKGRPNVSPVVVYSDKLSVSNCNFPVPKVSENTASRGTEVVLGGRVVNWNDSTPPYGVDFDQGTMIVGTTQKWIISSFGSFQPSNDYIKAAPVGQSYIEGNNIDAYWMSNKGIKQAGQSIVIPGAGENGSDLVTTIVRSPYAVSGNTRLNISDSIKTAVPTNTVIRPLNVAQFRLV